MSATVFGTARYGVVDDSTATGLFVGSVGYTYNSEQAFAKDHLGCDVSMSLYNDSTDVSISGVVKTQATGLAPAISDVLTLANSSADTLGLDNSNLFSIPVGGAGVIITGATMSRSNTEFETGELTAVYKPMFSSSTPVALT